MSTDADDKVPTWVRVVMVVTMAVPQLVIGLWALVAPRSWYDDFPGFAPHLISAEPPFNQHLATDVGAGFFALGVAVAVAALLGRRSGVYVALAAFAAFTIPHTIYHAAHEAPGLTSTEDVANVVVLATNLIWLVVVAWGARPRPSSIVLPAA